MRAGTVVPGTSNQEEEADASVAENETQVARVRSGEKRSTLKRNCVPVECCVSQCNRVLNKLSTSKERNIRANTSTTKIVSQTRQ